MNNKRILYPIIIALVLCLGMIIGSYMSISTQKNDTESFDNTQSSYDKLNAILNLLDQSYVDNIDRNKLTEDVLPEILSNLDPHSTYIPASEVEEANEDLEGSFSGIGVQFNIQNDTVVIVDVIAGGPSEKLGVRPGDRIVEVGDSSFTGSKINNNKVVKTLRGEKGTKVRIGIKRNNVKQLIHFNITRGDIPVNSVDIAYMLNGNTGYIKVSRFGANTYQEFVTELMILKKQGCKNYIIDLRNNSGGYLSAVIQMVNEFLDKNQLIVYTEGRSYRREDAVADGTGKFASVNVCVLINEWSASASEIFAGAIQDQDRGWIVGRRSFGKGLVQQQIPLTDGSEIHLTIARYYTPSGRCIQKPYKQGKIEDYEKEIEDRYNKGEFFAQDSIIASDSLKYSTLKGRSVYGGGGITPDFFVAQDTSIFTKFYMDLFNTGVLYDFAFKYADNHRNELSKYKDWKNFQQYLKTSNYWTDFVIYVDSKKVIYTKDDLSKSKESIENMLQAYICRNILGDKGFYPIINQKDKTLEKAIQVVETEIE